jgi:hypothetical protein
MPWPRRVGPDSGHERSSENSLLELEIKVKEKNCRLWNLKQHIWQKPTL